MKGSTTSLLLLLLTFLKKFIKNLTFQKFNFLQKNYFICKLNYLWPPSSSSSPTFTASFLLFPPNLWAGSIL